MYTKEQLKKQVENMGLTGEETILIHSSMKSIGEVEGGADTVLDALIEYFGHGLLLLPTHTWKNINADSPVFNSKERWSNKVTTSYTQHGRNWKESGRISGG